VLLEDLVNAATEQSFALDPSIRSRAEFERRLSAGRPEFVPNAERLRDLLATILREHRALRAKLSSAPNPSAVADLSAQLEALVYPGFLTATPPEWRTELPRYLRAAQLRSDKISARHPKDQEFQKRVQAAAKRLEQWRERQPAGWPWPAGVLRYRWLLEEFRVSLYAQTLGTRVPVSEKRLEEFWREAIATN
jgi:ATP-dependent helicase HrpA